jgi:SAM-dependent methyltransferase
VYSAPVSQAFEGAAAEAYSTIFESLAPAWNMHVKLIAADKADAVSILDIGSGPGEPSCTLAAAFPSAKITCTDVSADMNAKAKARAEQKGVEIAAFGVCGGEDLSQFADSSFDYVTMNFALMFVPDRAKCLQECARVLKPGGKVLSTVWKTNSFMVAIGTTMEKFTGEPNPPPPPVNPMALKGDNAQEELAAAAGLGVAHAEVMNVDITCKDEEVFRACSLIVVGPKLKEMEEGGRAGASQAFQDLFVEVGDTIDGITRDDQGGYAFGGLCQMVAMTKP